VAWLAAKRPVSLALAAACVFVDRAIPWQGMSFMVRTVIAGPCHVANAFVLLGAITRFRGAPPNPKFIASMVACALVIDLDHLPLEFGSSALTVGTPRPYTHALWVLALLIAAAVATRHWSSKPTPGYLLAGAAWGVGAHSLRDVATAPMSLWWPLSDAAVQVPYWWYVLALALMIVMPPLRSGVSDAPDEQQRSGSAASAEARTGLFSGRGAE
jgi:hypothetical protein